MLQALDENENIEFVFPKEGYIFTADTFVIPADASNVDLAYDFINFMHRPEIAAENMQFVKFRCPNTEALKMLPEKLKNKQSINPAKACGTPPCRLLISARTPVFTMRRGTRSKAEAEIEPIQRYADFSFPRIFLRKSNTPPPIRSKQSPPRKSHPV